MNTILVTGSTGFIGKHIVRNFVELGWNVVGIGTSSPASSPNSELLNYQRLTLPSSKLAEIVQRTQPDVCVHCAGRASVAMSVQDPALDFAASLNVTFDLLNALRLHAPQCHLIYLSSAAVYGNPTSLPISEDQETVPISPYGFHKLMCESLCYEFFKVYGLSSTIIRIFSAYGSGLKRQIVWDACQKALEKSVLRLQGTGNESRDFIHIQDVVRAITLLVEKANSGTEIYNLGSGIETKINRLAELLVHHLDEPIPIEFDGFSSVGNPLNWQADISRLSRLGFVPQVSLKEGLGDCLQWCRVESMER